MSDTLESQELRELSLEELWQRMLVAFCEAEDRDSEGWEESEANF